jgi:hypothetical protein
VLADDLLAGAKRVVGDRKELKAIYISRAGDPAEEILACTRGVSRKVAAAAGCSVVIVPKDR